VHLIRVADAATAAALAAEDLAAACREAVAVRGRSVVALSGGRTPWLMVERLREQELPWQHVFVAQVDERVVPRGDARRNLTRLGQLLVTEGPLPPQNLLAMPVESDDLELAAEGYQRRLEELAGRPLVLDVVQLGLGTDGHTASLVPDDPLLEVRNRDVALSREYQGVRRMTLTFPALDRARLRLWLVTGSSKAARLASLLAGDGGEAPALRVNRAETIVVADEAALSPALSH